MVVWIPPEKKAAENKNWQRVSFENTRIVVGE